MPSTLRSSASPSTSRSVFAWVNAFVGNHVECTDIGEDVNYDVRISDRTGECQVVVSCACGETATLAVRTDEGRALITVARRHGMLAGQGRRVVARLTPEALSRRA